MSGTPDNGTRYVILGALAMFAEQLRRFIEIKSIDPAVDSDGVVYAFIITTQSRRRYRVEVVQLDDELSGASDGL